MVGDIGGLVDILKVQSLVFVVAIVYYVVDQAEKDNLLAQVSQTGCQEA